MSAPYLDIHTHGRHPLEHSVVVASLSIDEINMQKISGDFSTAGIHPWWLEDYTAEEIEGLKAKVLSLLQAGKLWAIGETGIDRAYPEFLDQQKDLFEWHMELSESHHLPLIIHNVRAGSDFLELLKKRNPTQPWIFHDFRGNEDLMRKLLELHPASFFAFGISLDNSPQIRELLPLIPMENIFLETDAQKHLDIHDIYLRASEQLQVDLEFLKSQIWLNFKKINPGIPQ